MSFFFKRNIKLKSFLLDTNGNCKLSNFGEIILLDNFLRLPEIKDNIDYLNFGIIICQMLTGNMSFNDLEDFESLNLTNESAKDLIKDILNKKHENIQSKPFFSSIDWIKLKSGQLPSPFIPNVVNIIIFN
jgi:hypothetical protein